MMSTMEIRSRPIGKPRSLFAGFARFASFIGEVLDVFAEAQRQACEAERRYHFTSS
jgi:hypothetical protein